MVSKGKNKLAPGVESEFGTIGVRIPNHVFLLNLLKQYGKPITATSANGSGKKRPYSISDILDNLSNKQKKIIDLALDAGQLPPNPPSTVIDTTTSTPVVMRPGAVSQDQQSSSEKNARIQLLSTSEAETKAIAGRLLLKHWNTVRESGLAIGLDGPLGAGKTQFAMGIAEFLHISEHVTSPTYSYIEEYDYSRHNAVGRLYHLDMWKVESKIEFERLEVKQLVQPGSVVVIEWWEQVEAFWPELNDFLHVKIIDNDTKRKLTISENNRK